jgi:hypothetical protein
MQIYPFNSPIILTDDDFVTYGGKIGTFTAAQRQLSYWVAEMEATRYIGTPLLPVIVTGTYNFQYPGGMRIATDYGYVHQILSVTVYNQKSALNCDLQANDGCAYIYNDTFGYIDTRQVASACNCWSGYDYQIPYQIKVAYQAGLPTGTASRPGIQEALTILAQIDLNEKDPGNAGMNESPGDIGVQVFSSMNYREERIPLKKTALGSSAKAMYAARLLDISITKARPQLSLR